MWGHFRGPISPHQGGLPSLKATRQDHRGHKVIQPRAAQGCLSPDTLGLENKSQRISGSNVNHSWALSKKRVFIGKENGYHFNVKNHFQKKMFSQMWVKDTAFIVSTQQSYWVSKRFAEILVSTMRVVWKNYIALLGTCHADGQLRLWVCESAEVLWEMSSLAALPFPPTPI